MPPSVWVYPRDHLANQARWVKSRPFGRGGRPARDRLAIRRAAEEVRAGSGRHDRKDRGLAL